MNIVDAELCKDTHSANAVQNNLNTQQNEGEDVPQSYSESSLSEPNGIEIVSISKRDDGSIEEAICDDGRIYLEDTLAENDDNSNPDTGDHEENECSLGDEEFEKLRMRWEDLQSCSSRNIGAHRAFFEPCLMGGGEKLQSYRCVLCRPSPTKALEVNNRRRRKGFVTISTSSSHEGTSTMTNHANYLHKKALKRLRSHIEKKEFLLAQTANALAAR